MTIDSINLDTCIGCGECVLSCPMNVIQLDTIAEENQGISPDRSRPEIKHPDDCQTCWLCHAYCPVEAITISPVKLVRPVTGWG